MESNDQATSGFAGADLANMVNEAALLAARAKRISVEQQDLNAPLFSLPLIDNEGNLVKSQLVPDIPTINELYTEINGIEPSGINWDAIKTMLEIDQTMQHVFLGPPRMNRQAIEEIRNVLGPMMSSPAFIDEATRILSYTPESVDYERQEDIFSATAEVRPEVKEYIERQISKNNGF